MDEIIDIKTIGNITSKTFKPNLSENLRVYSYNFRTNKVELDEIVAVEQITGNFQTCELSTYKTVPMIMPSQDRIATVDRTLGYKLKFSTTKELLNTKGLAVLQIENYSSKCDEEISFNISNDSDELDIPMNFDMGVLIGHWLGIGKVYNDSVCFLPSSEAHATVIMDMLTINFPNHMDNVEKRYNKWDKIEITVTIPIFTDWIVATHGEAENKQLPVQYYSANKQFIDGLFYGLLMSTGRYSINNHKKVSYFTLSSISKTLTTHIIELLNLYESIHANLSEFTIEKTGKHLFLANIRVTSDVIDKLPITSFSGDIPEEYIPKSNRHTLKADDNLIVITRMTIKQVEDQNSDYIIHLKNNGNIIALNGVIHQAKLS